MECNGTNVLMPVLTDPKGCRFTTVEQSPCRHEAGNAEPSEEGSLLRLLLEDQHSLTAIEEFSKRHDGGELGQDVRRYTKLLPAAPPGPGQQYAFEVDLDRCSGCKACVAACHSLNGLDEQETWRDVGVLVGGTSMNPVMQHVTTACHHCLEPACMAACPVDAYEKDPITGIVRHLDDQCFGCQYCTLACPYDVPKYHAGKGIVRKCDMCAGRLAAGEAPACAQACPQEAITIGLANVAEVRENAEADRFLPAAPAPHLTFPTTTFKTERVFPRNLLPADYYAINPQHPHWPLIVMLVLTQLSVGAFGAGLVMGMRFEIGLLARFQSFQASLALGAGLLALAASTFHLGRPQYAFRAIVGLRHSWLSREIVAFGLFAISASLYAAAVWSDSVSVAAQQGLGIVVVATGLLGLICSVMIYVFTRRDFWSFERTILKFGLTALNLGLATTLLALMLFGITDHAGDADRILSQAGAWLGRFFIIGSVLKLAHELALLLHLFERQNSPMKRSARLTVGPLSNFYLARVLAGILGGIVMPLVLISRETSPKFEDASNILAVLILFCASLAGELLERYHFFAAVSAPRMPGGPRS